MTLLATWREGLSAHRLPIFGGWLFRDVTPSLQLASVLSTRPFRALATRTNRTVGGDASNFGTHSVRQGAAAALFHVGVPRSLVTQALRLAFARSDESCIPESAKLTAVTAASRIPLHGSSAGAAATPARQFDEVVDPSAGVLELLPAGAPQDGGPLGPWMASGLAALGEVRPANGRLPPPPLIGPVRGTAGVGCLRKRDRGYVLPHVCTASWHGPDRPECGRP